MTSTPWPSANIRYASRYIKRSANESSCWLVPGCGMHVPPPPHAAANAATGMFIGPVKVEFPGLWKSTWNLQKFSELRPKFKRKFGLPAGGEMVPSRSDGRRPPKDELSWKHTWVAAPPASIALRSYAQALLPAKLLPLNMLNVM